MVLIPRAYQIEAASGAIAGNTVINVCTGGGKTLIAVIVINDFIRKHPSKVVCFLVPSRALVSQQAAYLRLNCDEKEGKQLLIEGERLIF
jgi:ERCC4-related helicase